MSAPFNASDIGPLDLLYSSAEKVLELTQGAVSLHKLSDFVDSVRWKEPFIIGLLAFQVTLFLFAYATRKQDVIQFLILIFITGLTLGAEKLNELGHEHWHKFAKQDYFDRPGLFMVSFVSGPFVILANFIVLGMGLRLVKLYTRKKRSELRAQRESAATGASASARAKKDS